MKNDPDIQDLEEMIASFTLEVIKEQHTVDPQNTRGTAEEESISASIEEQKLDAEKDDEYAFKNLNNLEKQYHNKVLFKSGEPVGIIKVFTTGEKVFLYCNGEEIEIRTLRRALADPSISNLSLGVMPVNG